MLREYLLSPKALRPGAPLITQVVLKVASRCNLNCSYCYVYNKVDATWERRPALMSDEVFEAALQRVRRQCESSGQDRLILSFHGGEPCLLGAARFDSFCERIREVLRGVVTVDLLIQTNATLIDEAWVEVLRKHRVDVGVSMDGPPSTHDAIRVDHHGHGSHARVVRGLSLLHEGGVPFAILCVIPLGADPIAVHRHFLSLGCAKVTYLLPHFTHDTIAPLREAHGATPCADFLIPVFDDWWFNGTMAVCIGDLRNVARVVMGGASTIETLGNTPPRYVFVESDGEIEGLDNLRVCEEGMAGTRLNVLDADFRDILDLEGMHRVAIFQGMPLPEACRPCPEAETCAGGYLPHRHSAARGFDNPSVWCADLLKVFTHVRERLGVTVEETRSRREALARAGDEGERPRAP
jgi:uncharacterized protein